MHVISRKMLRRFWEEYPDAESALQAWHKAADKADWQSFADVRALFPHADQVDKFTVFNIGGNKYRLITYVRFDWPRYYIKHVLTHADYDKGTWKS